MKIQPEAPELELSIVTIKRMPKNNMTVFNVKILPSKILLMNPLSAPNNSGVHQPTAATIAAKTIHQTNLG